MDRPEDEEHRADMLARLSRAHMRLGEWQQAVDRADEALAIAEPKRYRRIVAEAFVNKAAALGGLRRIREPPVLMAAAVELAHESGDITLELRARNNLGAVLAYEDLGRAQAEAREAYELATRLGIGQMTTWTAGAVAWGSVYEGIDWEASLVNLDREIEGSLAAGDQGRLIAIRQLIVAWRGEMDERLTAQRRQLLEGISDPDTVLWDMLVPAHLAVANGDYGGALGRFSEAVMISGQNTTDARFGYILASQLLRDPEAARAARAAMADEPYAGSYVDALNALAEAGMAALGGRTDAALTAYRECLALFAHVGVRFHAALVRLAALVTLPDERSIDAWAADARERFEVVKSPALVERLDETVAARGQVLVRSTEHIDEVVS